MRYGTQVLREWLQTAFRVALGASGLWLGAYGCQGSEHVVLAPIVAGPDNLSGGSSGGGTGGSSPVDGGNSQPPDSGDAGLDARVPEIDAGLDPDVVFDWTETLPGLGMCGPGQYVGSFSCFFEGRPAAPIVVGEISLDVAETSEGETGLLMTGLMRDGFGTELFLNGTINGTLDCALNTLSGTVEMGTAAGLFGVTAMFNATLHGTFDPQTLAVLGEIVMVNDDAEVCIGSFQVGVTP